MKDDEYPGQFFARFVKDKMRGELSSLESYYPHEYSFEVNYSDLIRYDGNLTDENDIGVELYHNPRAVLEEFNEQFNGLSKNLFNPYSPLDPEIPVIVRIKNQYDRNIPIRNLRAFHLGKFITVEGLVRKSTEIKNELTKTVHVCQAPGCNHRIEIHQIEDQLITPKKCKCGASWWKELTDKREFKDIQRITIQEAPEGLGGGEQPKSLEVTLYDDLVGRVTAGDRIKCTGTMMPLQGRKGSKVFGGILIANSIELEESDYSQLNITEEDLLKFDELSKDPRIIDKIADSIATTIYGYHNVKQAFAVSLFGGVAKVCSDGTKSRGDSHMLVCGDAGIAKSKMMRSVGEISPRSVYASGKSSSGAGLTATVVRDELDGKWTLEAGAAVLADGGVLILDELDKMANEDRSSMHEVMEDQELSINKAGINATLKTRCTVIAACNPKTGRFDDYMSLSEQIGLPPSLVSRFDLIFLLQDKPNKDTDERIAKHILKKHMITDTVPLHIPRELLRKYIAHAKETVFPVIGDDVNGRIEAFYVDLRCKSQNGMVTVTPRQLEGVVRMSEAFARMRLSETVDLVDVERAINLYETSIGTIAQNEDGVFDIDKVVSKKSGKGREIGSAITEMLRANDNQMKKEDLVRSLMGKGWTDVKLSDTIEAMLREAILISPKNGVVRLL